MVYLTKIRGNLSCGYTNIHFMSSQPQHIQELLLPPVDVYWQSDQPVAAIHSDSRKVWWPNTVPELLIDFWNTRKGGILFMRFLHMATLTMQALVWITTTYLNILCSYGCSVFFILLSFCIYDTEMKVSFTSLFRMQSLDMSHLESDFVINGVLINSSMSVTIAPTIFLTYF